MSFFTETAAGNRGEGNIAGSISGDLVGQRDGRGSQIERIRTEAQGRCPEEGAYIGAEEIIRESISGDSAGQKKDEGSFRGNRQNVFELGVAHAERVVLAPSPTH
jgi:hypothetical protein